MLPKNWVRWPPGSQLQVQAVLEYGVAHPHPVVLLLPRRPHRRESLSSEAAGAFPGAQGEATEDDSNDSADDGGTGTVL